MSVSAILPEGSINKDTDIVDIICGLWCHILYMREQIPFNLGYLRSCSSTEGTSQRGASKWIQQVENAKQDLIACCASLGRIDNFRIMVGQTMSAPREIYTIHVGRGLVTSLSSKEHTPTVVRINSSHQAMSVIIRTLCGYWAEVVVPYRAIIVFLTVLTHKFIIAAVV